MNRKKILRTRQEVWDCLDQAQRRKLIHLVDTQNLLREETSLASFTAGFKLAWRLSKDLEADGLYCFEEEETERVCRQMGKEECEEKLKVLIRQLTAGRKAIRDRMRGLIPTEKLTKKQRHIWEHMRLYPDETNYSVIAKGAKVTRHTVAKWYEIIQKMLGIKETAPHTPLDCQAEPLMV